MNKLYTLLFALLATTSLWAFDFQYGDLYYDIVDDKNFEVSVVRVLDYNDENYNTYRYLTRVVVPATIDMFGVTYTVVGISYSAFKNCRNLKYISLPNTIEYIGVDAFANSGVYENNDYWTDGMMYLNHVLVSVRTFLAGDLVIPDGTTVIGAYAFKGCSKLTSVTIPEGVTSIGGSAFYGCSSQLTITVIGNRVFDALDSYNVEYIGQIVNGLKIKDNTIIGVVDAAKLTSVTIPNSVTSIGDNAFSDCKFLTSITIPESVTSIGKDAFNACTSLNTIIWNAKKCQDFTSNNKYFSPSITNFIIGDSVEYIPAFLCKGLDKLTSVTIPNSVTSIGNNAFSGCKLLSSITIPESITSIRDGVFYNCSSLTTVTIPNSLTSIGESAFRDCSALTSLVIPNSVTSLGFKAFSGCTSLSSVTIPESVTSIGYQAFSGCSSLTSMTIPESITSIGYQAFSGCSSLSSITIPESVTSIGSNAFSGCSSLTSVTILSNSIVDKASMSTIFGEQVTEYIIGNSVTSIGYKAFSGCKLLSSVTIPKSVTSIGEWAFWGCQSLLTVNYSGTKKQWKAIQKAKDLTASSVKQYVLCTDGKIRL